MKFQRGCQQVLDLMQEVSEDNMQNLNNDGIGQNPLVKPLISRKPTKYGSQDNLKDFSAVNDDIDNVEQDDENEDDENLSYHSDSDSTVMMSGNSPFVSKAARYNFLSRSIRSGSRHGMLRPARSTGNLIDISSPPSLNEKEAAIKHHRRDSPSLESEKNDSDNYDRKFYPSNKASKSYTSTVSSKIKKQNLSIGINVHSEKKLAIPHSHERWR
jgi:hypothetical protein